MKVWGWDQTHDPRISNQTCYRLCYRAWQNQPCTYLGIHEAQLSCLEEEHYNLEEASPLPSLEEETFLYQQHLLSIHVVLVLTWEYMRHSCHAWRRNTIIWRRHLHYHPWRRRHSYIRFPEKQIIIKQNYR